MRSLKKSANEGRRKNPEKRLAAKHPFSVYERRTKKKGRSIYYVQFRDRDDNYLSGVSSGQTSKSAAVTWATEQLRNGAVPTRVSLTFGEYAQDWWTERSDYVRARRARGNSVSPGYMAAMRTYLNRHLIPIFGGMRLSVIRPTTVERWLLDQYESGPLSPTTINHTLRCLKIMTKEAKRLGYLSNDPAEGVGQLKEHRKEKTILLRRLLRIQQLTSLSGSPGVVDLLVFRIS